ncbi:MAG: UvrD-helicase domain-containing protein [Candidatus Daviesbacteria bacterium]|nr:UvrD-helicase domain-containing protein [Candidatus Daviesbacteria bacterium]
MPTATSPSSGVAPLSINLLFGLNPIQKEAVLHTEGPTLILAGAGSGKTKALTHRVAYLIKEKKVPAENILCITFTNKSAAEMMDRINRLLDDPERPHMGTFHSICAKILRKDGHHIGLSSSFSIYDENDSQDAIKEAMKYLNIATQKTSPGAVKGMISSAKSEMIGALEYPSIARGYFQETVAKIYLEYQKILERNRAVDFDDLLLLTVKLLQNHPEVLTSYQILFRYILVDEYQDTNAVQYLLTKLLAKRHKNICVVGDAAQSIYKFRGADFRNIVNFKNDYPLAKVFNLEQNYRSTQNILDTAHAVISKNRSHPILKLWTENPTGDKIAVIETKNEEDEAMFIVQKVSELKLSYPEIAVLYRTNAQSRSIEEVFIKAGVPYVLVGGTRFYERKEIKDILSYLRLLCNPQDSVSKSRIEKVGKGRASKFWLWAAEVLPYVIASEVKQPNTEIASSSTTPRNDVSYSTLELMDKILEVTGYLEYIDDGTEVGKSKVENVKELRSVAENSPNLVEFLERVTLVENEYFSAEHKDRWDGNKNKKRVRTGITLTTLHQAKGLEWPTVFLVGMEEGLFPHSRSFLDPLELEEERRLCYVGITRAKNQLFLTYARQRLYFGTRSNNLVSRFLADIPQELINSEHTYRDESSDPSYRRVPVYIDEEDWLNS